MLKETKLALRVSTAAYDDEIISLIRAGVQDLQIAGVNANGEAKFATVTDDDGVSSIEDRSTINDPLVQRAIITYVRCHFGSPEDYERLAASYDEQKAQLSMATRYTDWGENDEEG